MSDKMTPEQRHRCMSHVRSKDTKPEMTVRRYLFVRGFRYRIHVKNLPGKPDIVLRKYRAVIFVNGCFWRSKIERNRERDLREAVELRSQGWHVIKIWECQLKPKVRTATLTSLEYTLNCIFLMNHGAKEHSEAKPYEEAKSPVPIAAELCEKYGNNQGE